MTVSERTDADGLREIRARFDAALRRVLDRLQPDPYVLAAILFGSMAHDTVWRKSDIDLVLVVQDGAKKRVDTLSLVEDGVTVHAMVVPRSEFRRITQGSPQSGFLNSALSKGRVLYTRDPSIASMLADTGGLGDADRAAGLLNASVGVLGAVAKAEKWHLVRGDSRYAFFWIMKAVDGLAAVETLLHGEVPGREVLEQAMRHHPAFFTAVYSDLVDGPKTPAAIGAALAAIDGYLRDRAPDIFAPVFEHLDAAGGPRSSTDLNHHFQTHMNLEGLDPAYEWLAEQGFIDRAASPARLSEKSRADMQEAGYHYAAR